MNNRKADAAGQLKEKEIHLKAILLTLKKRLWLIALIAVGLTILAGLYNARPETPIYSSSSRIIVGASNDLRGTANVLLREPVVLEQVIEKLGLRQSPEGLRSQIRVSSVDSSLVTLVTVIDTNPMRAADTANALIEAYRGVASQTLGITNIRVLTEAEPNGYPINGKSNTILVIAFMIGLFLGVCLTFFLESLDDSIRTERDVEKLLELSTLGQVSKMKRGRIPAFPKKHKSNFVRGETIGS